MPLVEAWLKPISCSTGNSEWRSAFQLYVKLDENAGITSAPKLFSLGFYVQTEKEKVFLSLKCESARIFPVSFFSDFNFAIW